MTTTQVGETSVAHPTCLALNQSPIQGYSQYDNHIQPIKITHQLFNYEIFTFFFRLAIVIVRTLIDCNKKIQKFARNFYFHIIRALQLKIFAFFFPFFHILLYINLYYIYIDRYILYIFCIFQSFASNKWQFK